MKKSMSKKLNNFATISFNEGSKIVGGGGIPGWVGWLYTAATEAPDFVKGFKKGYRSGSK